MKIGNSPELNAYTKLSNERTGAADAGKAKAGKAGGADAGSQVELSSTASSLIAGSGSEDGSFDAEKVSRIAKAIEEGKFTINADAIADKLIANASEMVSRAQPSH